MKNSAIVLWRRSWRRSFSSQKLLEELYTKMGGENRIGNATPAINSTQQLSGELHSDRSPLRDMHEDRPPSSAVQRPPTPSIDEDEDEAPSEEQIATELLQVNPIRTSLSSSSSS
jgi:hypothetical protein